MGNIFDSHAHYDDKAFDDDRDSLLRGLAGNDVCRVVNVGSDIKSSENSVQLSSKFPFVFAAVGVHPHAAAGICKEYLDTLAHLCEHEKVVAIGEIGLDYHYDFSPKTKQIQVFEQQLELAKSLNIPVIIHDREAHEDTLALLKKYRPAGVVHCFSGSVEMAREIVNLGMYVGLGGSVTFKNAKNPVLVAKELALTRILLETDAPYLAPVPHRGSRCDSSMIKFVAEKISEIKSVPVPEILKQTKSNACSLFSVPEQT